jgi:hypothetical protein
MEGKEGKGGGEEEGRGRKGRKEGNGRKEERATLRRHLGWMFAKSSAHVPMSLNGSGRKENIFSIYKMCNYQLTHMHAYNDAYIFAFY